MYTNLTMTQFKPIKQIADDMIAAGNRNYARMYAKNRIMAGLECKICGQEMTLALLSNDADGLRPEYSYVCTNCE